MYYNKGKTLISNLQENIQSIKVSFIDIVKEALIKNEKTTKNLKIFAESILDPLFEDAVYRIGTEYDQDKMESLAKATNYDAYEFEEYVRKEIYDLRCSIYDTIATSFMQFSYDNILLLDISKTGDSYEEAYHCLNDNLITKLFSQLDYLINMSTMIIFNKSAELFPEEGKTHLLTISNKFFYNDNILHIGPHI